MTEHSLPQDLYATLETEILQLLDQNLSPTLLYHNTAHTVHVIEAALWLCKAEMIPETEILKLKIAALFHDTGFLRSYDNHERYSCDIAREYLSRHRVAASDIESICALIMATRIPHNPQNQLDAILCDADLTYLGEQNFYTTGDCLRQELIAHQKISKDEASWIQYQIRFLDAHQFFTESFRRLREPVKQHYLNELKDQINEK